MRQVNDEEDDYRSRAAVNRKEKMSKGLFKLPEGETIIRILKTPKDEERKSPSVWIEYYVHRNVGPKKLTVRCGKDVINDQGPCWMCKVVRLLKEKGKTKRAADMEKQKVYAVQVAILDEDIGGLRGPLLWPMASGKSAKSLSFKVESIVASKKDYLDHKAGYNFTFERQGTGMLDTVYGKTERDDEPSRVPKQIVEKLKPFVDVVLQYDPENQKQAYYGKVAEDDGADEKPKRKATDEDGDEDETPAPKRKRLEVPEDEEEEEPTPKKKKPAPAEEDEEEELEEDEVPPKKKKPAVVEEDEDEEEPTPKAKKKPTADDEDDDLSFPEEEEEEEPKPKAKKKPAVEEDEEEEELEEETPAPKKKKPAAVEEDEDEEEPTPKAKKKPTAAEEDDEAYLTDDEEEEAPKAKKKKAVADEDLDDDLDEEPKPKAKKKAVVDEDEDE